MGRSHDAVKKLQLRALERLRARAHARLRHRGGAPWSVTSACAPTTSTATGTRSSAAATNFSRQSPIPDLADLVDRLHERYGPGANAVPRSTSMPGASCGVRRSPDVRPWPHPNGRERSPWSDVPARARALTFPSLDGRPTGDRRRAAPFADRLCLCPAAVTPDARRGRMDAGARPGPRVGIRRSRRSRPGRTRSSPPKSFPPATRKRSTTG